jgi:chromosome segregation ATPase
MLRAAILVMIAASSAVSAFAVQGDLAALAKKERQRRAKIATPGKVLTEDDGKAATANEKGTVTSSTPDPSAPAAAPPRASSAQPNRADWKARADASRAAIAAADAAIKNLEKEIGVVQADLAPLSASEAQDPMRMQKKEARVAQMNAQLGSLRQAAAQARKDFSDLETEARRNGVPAGWLR